MRITSWGLALMCLATSGLAGAHSDHAAPPAHTDHAAPAPLVDHVRKANQRFEDVAVAVAEGYAPIPCASGQQGGAMGIHYVNAALLNDGVIDIARPEAVMYEPTAHGKLTLVAVEYISFEGPASLENQLFNFTPAPNRYGLAPFYELHVWAWRKNPDGHFADNNPNVSCNAATLR